MGRRLLPRAAGGGYTRLMKILSLLALTLAAAPVLAKDHPDDPFYGAFPGPVEVEAKSDPCLAENLQLNFFEVLFEAVPLYAPAGKVAGAPPRSVVLTMDRCDTHTRDHVEGYPMTPTAARWYTDGDWGLILSTRLGSETTFVTVVSKMGGTWANAGQMGEFKTVELFDVWNKGKAAVKLAHYRDGGVQLPYAVHVSIRPSWNR